MAARQIPLSCLHFDISFQIFANRVYCWLSDNFVSYSTTLKVSVSSFEFSFWSAKLSLILLYISWDWDLLFNLPVYILIDPLWYSSCCFLSVKTTQVEWHAANQYFKLCQISARQVLPLFELFMTCWRPTVPPRSWQWNR